MGPPLLGDIWTRRGISILWDAEMLAGLCKPSEVISLRQFLQLLSAGWPDDSLPLVRDQALVNNLYSLSLVVDAEDTLPGFIFSETNEQKRYWMMFKSLHPEFKPQWSSPFYVDAREI